MDRSTVIVVRAEDEFSEGLRSGGVAVINLPLIETRPLTDQSRLRRILAKIQEYDGLFFTSPVAAEAFIGELGEDTHNIGAKIYAMGSRANRTLQRAGFNVKYDTSINSAAELVDSFKTEFNGKRFLFLRGDRSMLTIPDMLKGKAQVDEVVVYSTIKCPVDSHLLDKTRNSLLKNEIDWVCLFSPSGVEAFEEYFGTYLTAKIAAIGETTAEKARRLGFSVDFIASRSNAAEFASELLQHINDK